MNSVKPMGNKESQPENPPMGTNAGPAILNVMTGSSEDSARKVNCQTRSITEMSNISSNNSKFHVPCL